LTIIGQRPNETGPNFLDSPVLINENVYWPVWGSWLDVSSWSHTNSQALRDEFIQSMIYHWHYNFGSGRIFTTEITSKFYIHPQGVITQILGILMQRHKSNLADDELKHERKGEREKYPPW
jgi:hypothetical protein